MSFYPLNLDINGKRSLVVGGGKVAHRKVVSLLSYGARVEVVSPSIIPSLQKLVQKGVVKYMECEFAEHMLDGCILVFGAAGDSEVNRQVARAAEKRSIPVNIADAPELCTFQVPAVMSSGDINISISTGGNSPALARSLREKLSYEIGPEMEQLNHFLGKVRAYLLQHCDDPEWRRQVLQCLGDYRVAEFYRRGEGEELEKAVWMYIEARGKR